MMVVVVQRLDLFVVLLECVAGAGAAGGGRRDRRCGGCRWRSADDDAGRYTAGRYGRRTDGRRWRGSEMAELGLLLLLLLQVQKVLLLMMVVLLRMMRGR